MPPLIMFNPPTTVFRNELRWMFSLTILTLFNFAEASTTGAISSII
jgi:hypothetical protein